jgi:Domain of unknown function DUF29
VTLRRDIERRLTPVLRRDLRRHIQRRYEEARSDPVTTLERYGEGDGAEGLPERCPYTLDQVLGDFWPDRQSGRERPGP